MGIKISGAPAPGWMKSQHPQTGKPVDYASHLNEPQQLKGKEVQGTVQVGEAVTHIPVHPGVIGDMKVGCGGSRTVNLGNYESIKLSVHLEMPCTKETLPQSWEFVSDWVGEHLDQALKAVKGK